MDYRQALRTGALLGARYRVRAVAARDDFSITYAAEIEGLGERVLVQEFFPIEVATRDGDAAIKPRSPVEAAALAWGCEQLRAEGRILPGLSHPSLLRLLDTVEENETVYRVFSAVDGVSLAAWAANLKRRPTQSELDRLLVPLLAALEALHGAGLIHADLRPERISLRADGTPLIAPFGQARWGVAARANRLHAVVTPGYAPPEQYVFDEAAQGPWTDVYGLAATLYRLMMGRAPADALARRMSDEFAAAATAPLHEYRFGFRQAVDLALSLPQARRPQTIALWRGMLLGDAAMTAVAAAAAAAPAAPSPPASLAPLPPPPTMPQPKSPAVQPAAMPVQSVAAPVVARVLQEPVEATVQATPEPPSKTPAAAPSLPPEPAAPRATASRPIEGYPQWTRSEPGAAPAESQAGAKPAAPVRGLNWGLVAGVVVLLIAIIAGAGIALQQAGGPAGPVVEAPSREAGKGSVPADAARRGLELELERQEAQRQEAQRQEARRQEAQRAAREAEERKAREQREAAARTEAAKAEASRVAAARAEAERAEAAKAEAARIATAKAEAERAEADRLARIEEDRRLRIQAEQDARRTRLASIATETGRERLLDIAAADPESRPAALSRLAELGFVEIATTSGSVWRRPGAGEAFRDCPDCPQLVAVPAGEARIGAPADEAGRRDDEDDTAGPGGAPVLVRVPRPFAIARSEVTRGEFARFVAATGHAMTGGCHARYGGWKLVEELSWQSPGFQQDDSHPVVCVSWLDARAYAAWLAQTTGQPYRLPTEAEWEYAARALVAPTARAPRFAFGDADTELCGYANGADAAAREVNPGWSVAPCRDGHRQTAPTGSLKPNAWGLHDMHGNVWEWMEDCYRDSLRHLKDAVAGPALAPDVCGAMGGRVLKGGSWSDMPAFLRSASRIMSPRDVRDEIVGFRVVRDLTARAPRS